MIGLMVAGDPPPKCGIASKSGLMHCELPPDHVVAGRKWEWHYGRNRLGHWRSWGVKP